MDENQILPELEKYYGNLYLYSVTEDLLNQFTEGVQLPRLSNEERETIEGLWSFEECKKVVESFQNDKSPGEDGFTSEFYSTFLILLVMTWLIHSMLVTKMVSYQSRNEEG